MWSAQSISSFHSAVLNSGCLNCFRTSNRVLALVPNPLLIPGFDIGCLDWAIPFHVPNISGGRVRVNRVLHCETADNLMHSDRTDKLS